MAVDAKTVPLNENPLRDFLGPITLASYSKAHGLSRAFALTALDHLGRLYKGAESQEDRIAAISLFISTMWEGFRWDATPDAEHLMMQLSQALEDLRLGSYPNALLPVSGNKQPKKPKKFDVNQWMLRAIFAVGWNIIVEANAERKKAITDVDEEKVSKDLYKQLSDMLERNGIPAPALKNILKNFTAESRITTRNDKRDVAFKYYVQLKEHIRVVRLEQGYSAREMERYFEEEILAKDPFIPRKPKKKVDKTG
jgi:hypothetical protein